MTATVWSAAWFLPFVLPITLWVAWSDLSRMIIPNIAVMSLLVVFIFVGLIALPLDIYIWRLVTGLGVLAIGFGLYLIGGIGAGDIKFAAAMAPFFDHGDGAFVVYLFAGVLLSSVATHRLARRVRAIKRAAPGWVSWDSKKFPMGLALSTALAFYLLAALAFGT